MKFARLYPETLGLVGFCELADETAARAVCRPERIILPVVDEGAPAFNGALYGLTTGIAVEDLQWVQSDDPAPVGDPDAEPAPVGYWAGTVRITYSLAAVELESARADLKGQVASARYEAEVAGIVVNARTIDTSRESQAKLNAVVTLMQLPQAPTSLQWKCKDGSFVTLDAASAISVGLAVAAHVQAQFNREAELVAAIDGCGTVDELAALDLTF